MRRRLFISLLFLTLIMVLSSCHKGSNRLAGFNLPDEFDETQEYNISFWAKNDGNTEQVKIYQDAIAKFEEYYPNINVELRNFSSYPDIYNDVLVNIATNTTPNVCIAYPDHVATYKEGNNIVVDLNTLMDHPQYGLGAEAIKFDSVKKEEIFEKFLLEGEIGDNYYTLPFMRSTEACYINKQYVEKLGYEIPETLTWDWMWDVCEAALKAKEEELKTNPNADSVLYPMIYKSTDNMFITMCNQQGIELSTDEGEVLLFNEDVKQLLVELGNRGYNKQFTTFKKVSYPGNFYNKWECVMAIDSTAGSTWMGVGATSTDSANGYDPSKPVFETVVKPVPQYDTENPLMISQGPSICLFNKENTQEVIASWLFAQFLITDEVQLAYSKTEGYLPVTSRATSTQAFQNYLNDEKEYIVKRKATKLVLDNVNNTFITPVFNGSANVRDSGSYLIEAVCGVNNRYKKYEDMDGLFEKCIDQNNLAILMDNNVNLTPKKEISPIAITMICIIGGIWIIMGAYVISGKVKERRKR